MGQYLQSKDDGYFIFMAQWNEGKYAPENQLQHQASVKQHSPKFRQQLQA